VLIGGGCPKSQGRWWVLGNSAWDNRAYNAWIWCWTILDEGQQECGVRSVRPVSVEYLGKMAETLTGSLEEDDSLLDGLYNNGKQSLESGDTLLPLQSIMTRSDSKSMRRKSLIRPSLETEDLLNLLHGSDPVRVELSRLENEVRGKSGILFVFCVVVSESQIRGSAHFFFVIPRVSALVMGTDNFSKVEFPKSSAELNLFRDRHCCLGLRSVTDPLQSTSTFKAIRGCNLHCVFLLWIHFRSETHY
jgi:hypothetical protein